MGRSHGLWRWCDPDGRRFCPPRCKQNRSPSASSPGFNAPATEEDAAAETLAGAHPYQQTISFGFPTKNPGDGLTNDGHPRDF